MRARVGLAARRPSTQACASRRGFSLMELMVVIIVIGIMAVLAIPTMSAARLDGLAYTDAGQIMQLLRSARTRAIARGGSVLVTMHADGGGDRGTFLMFEAVTANAGASGTTGLARTPVATCKTPTDWSVLPTAGQANPNVLLVDGVNLNGTLENKADIRAAISLYSDPLNSGATAEGTQVNVCWTPLGRSYIFVGANRVGMFDGLQPTISPLAIQVKRTSGGTNRNVLLPPNGMARLFSSSVVAQP